MEERAGAALHPEEEALVADEEALPAEADPEKASTAPETTAPEEAAPRDFASPSPNTARALDRLMLGHEGTAWFVTRRLHELRQHEHDGLRLFAFQVPLNYILSLE